jgi:bacterioferritin-associated ferredoxin
MYVCHCRVVTSGTIRALARRGLRTPREVTQETGAGSVCGRCQPVIGRILRSMEPTDASTGPTQERER